MADASDVTRDAAAEAEQLGQTADADHLEQATDPDLDAQIRLALATWPQLDPEVEWIVTRVAKANRYFERAARASLARVGLTKEEFKVLVALHRGRRSHGALCRELDVSTGAMTNRLDKLERSGLVARSRDPHDRRGVLLELSSGGRQKLDESIHTGALRERELLAALDGDEKRELNVLLQKLVSALQAELGESRQR
jgi:DNA-binding MarR family transcriptional regulator